MWKILYQLFEIISLSCKYLNYWRIYLIGGSQPSHATWSLG